MPDENKISARGYGPKKLIKVREQKTLPKLTLASSVYKNIKKYFSTKMEQF